jgi:hypothetical protein
MDTPNLNQISDLTNQQRTNTQGFLAGQNNQQQDFLNRFNSTIGGQETTQAMAGRLGKELNLPTLNKNAFSLQQQLYDLPGVENKALTGFDVNNNQRQQVINQKTSEIAPAAQRAQDQANFAQGQVTQQMGYAQRDQDRQLIPLQTEQQMLGDRLAREATMYSQENQSELDGLIAKVNAGVTLSEGEKNRANELAVAEQSYQNQMKLQQQQQGFSASQQKPGTEIIDVGGHKKLINTQTGQVIQDIGSSAAPVAASNISSYLPAKSTSSSAPSYFKALG